MAPQRSKSDASYSGIRGVDPYIDWVLGAGGAHYFPAGRQQEWLTVLVRLRGISARDFATGNRIIKDAKRRAKWQASVHVPKLYTERDDGVKGETHCGVFVTRAFFDFLRGDSTLQEHVVQVTLGLPLDTASFPFAKADKTARKARS